MRKYLTAVPLAVLALLVLATPASAGRTWCRNDPDFNINGRLVHVYVSSYAEMFPAATGPVKVVLTVPSGASAQLISADNGFGYGYDIKIEYSSKLKVTATAIQIQVSVYAPATNGSLPVKVEVEWEKTNNAGVKTVTKTKAHVGTANKWVIAPVSIN